MGYRRTEHNSQKPLQLALKTFHDLAYVKFVNNSAFPMSVLAFRNPPHKSTLSFKKPMALGTFPVSRVDQSMVRNDHYSHADTEQVIGVPGNDGAWAQASLSKYPTVITSLADIL